MKQAIYILDGMGPQAGGYLYNMLIEMAVGKYNAKNNNDFPEIILHSVPVPDFISDDKSRTRALKILKKRVSQIQKGLCISIACNTAHVLLDQLQKVSRSPFVSIVDEVVNCATQSKIKKVGILGTPSTLKYKIYQAAFRKKGIKAVVPVKIQINTLEQIIRNILKGKSKKNDQRRLVLIANSLKGRGAQAIILGCTELPLVFPKKYSVPVYNSVEILASALLNKYYGQNTINQ